MNDAASTRTAAQFHATHAARLERARIACRTRENWSAFAEQPSAYPDHAQAEAAGRRAFERWLGTDFPLSQPGTRAWVGEEVSPYTQQPLGIRYPRGDLDALFTAERVFGAALCAGALSVDALKGSIKPFDPRISEVRGQPGQIRVAAEIRGLLDGSEIRDVLDKLDDEPTSLVRRDPYFASLGLTDDDVRTREQVVGVLVEHPRLLQRPVLVRGQRAIIGRPKDRVAPFLEG